MKKKKCGSHSSFKPVCNFAPPATLQSTLHWEKKRLRGRDMYFLSSAISFIRTSLHSVFSFRVRVSSPNSLVLLSSALVDWVWFVCPPPGKALHAASISGLQRRGFLYTLSGAQTPFSPTGCPAALSRPTSWRAQSWASMLRGQTRHRLFTKTTVITRCAAFPALIPHGTLSMERD